MAVKPGNILAITFEEADDLLQRGKLNGYNEDRYRLAWTDASTSISWCTLPGCNVKSDHFQVRFLATLSSRQG